MMSLLLGMIRTRRAQAATVFLLSVVATAAAVAGPVALGAVDQAIVRQEVAAAADLERSIAVTAFVDPTGSEASSTFGTVSNLLSLPGFDAVRAGELTVFGPVADGFPAAASPTSRFVFRDRICEHVLMVTGRCIVGPLEIMIGEDTARRTGLDAGDVAVVQAARSGEGQGMQSDGRPARVTVVGIYRPVDMDEPYWAGQFYFTLNADGTRREAVFSDALTFHAVEHSVGQSALTVLAPPSALTLERLSGLPDELTRLLEPISDDSNYMVRTEIPALVERIETSREVARQLVPVAFIPLVGIAFFVIFLAVGYGIFGRRQELGLVTLRGIHPLRRWWLATGESLAAIVAGAPVGYFAGHAAVGAVASWRFGSAAGAEISLRTAPYALLALAGAVSVALLGQRRVLAEPVVELFRGVPRGAGRWRSAVADVVVLSLAILATLQLRATAEGLTGVGLLGPGLVVVAIAILAARAFGPVAGGVARLALRRGWVGSGLAAVQIARRPGSQRLFVLLAVASAMLVFVVSGMDVADRARDDRARITTGAPTVLTIDQTDPAKLLHVTRTVDPAGEWAMGVIAVPQLEELAPPLLAIDSERLAAVSEWQPGFGPDVAEVAAALRPAGVEPFTFRGTRLAIDLERIRWGETRPIDIAVTFIPLAGGGPIVGTIEDVGAGRAVREVAVFGCTEGCRFASISLPRRLLESVRLVVHSIKQVDPEADVVPAAALVDRGRWRTSAPVQVAGVDGALSISADLSPFLVNELAVAAIDSPLPVPIALAGSMEGGLLTGLDGQPVEIAVAQRPAMLPRLASRGALVDLSYLERTALSVPQREQAEVWLGPAAPADAADQLRAAGLAIVGSTGVEQVRATLARQGPALALEFHLAAAALGVVLALGGLGLVAAVDRRQRSADFRSLRRQGVPRRFIGRAAFGGYVAIVVAAATFGLGAAAAAWWAAGDRLPVFTDSVGSLGPPRWPILGTIAQVWMYAAAAMALAALVAGFALRRASSDRAVARNGRE